MGRCGSSIPHCILSPFVAVSHLSERMHVVSKHWVKRTVPHTLTPMYFLETDYYRLEFHPHHIKHKSQNRDGFCSKELCSSHSSWMRLLANILLLLELVSIWINTIFLAQWAHTLYNWKQVERDSSFNEVPLGFRFQSKWQAGSLVAVFINIAFSLDCCFVLFCFKPEDA